MWLTPLKILLLGLQFGHKNDLKWSHMKEVFPFQVGPAEQNLQSATEEVGRPTKKQVGQKCPEISEFVDLFPPAVLHKL